MTGLMLCPEWSCSGIIILTVAIFSGQSAGEINFSRDIRPIFSDRCYQCHGPDEAARKANLRFDVKEGAFADLGGYRALVPGQPDESEMIVRIESSDEDDLMPPPDSHLSLSREEKKLLRQWVREGAKWEEHWSFRQIRRPAIPKAKGDWGNNPIDDFVLAQLKRAGVKPSAPAERVVWLRRVTQDLTGLPPEIEEIDAFLNDDGPDAKTRVVDRLFAGNDHAEHMAAKWMDLARYADSNGFQFDNERTMWLWRDWVIEAFRQNMPYDRFIIEQLAGDLLDGPTQDQLIATGFNRNHGYSIEGGIIDEEYRVMYANDKTTTFGTLFLGLTMDCTRCHDHKYDPLTMEDYYSLFAFFNTSAEKGAPGENGRKQKAAPPFLEIKTEDGGLTRAMIMKEQARNTHVLKQGLFDKPGKKVNPRTPAVLPPFDGYPQNRLGLARWLTSDKNPLFARVTVNRLWQQFFGVGLVATPDNFGLQGEAPSHPELLDWLAEELRQTQWDLRHLMRLIVLSDTYAQSSNQRQDLDDPENRLLGRGPRFRLSAEMIRDQALAASGLLHRKLGGPSVRPYQPDGVWGDLNAPDSHAERYVSGEGRDLYRRSLYTYWRRAVPHPAMTVFDAPSRDVCTVKRETTNTPLQALVTLHGPTYLEASRVLAGSCIGLDRPIHDAFRRILSRAPTERELGLLESLYEDRLNHYRNHPEAAKTLLAIGRAPIGTGVDEPRLAAMADLCHTLFNLSETLTRK